MVTSTDYWNAAMEEQQRFCLMGERLDRQNKRMAASRVLKEQLDQLLRLHSNLSNAGSIGVQDWLDREIDRLREIHALREQMREHDQRIAALTKQLGD